MLLFKLAQEQLSNFNEDGFETLLAYTEDTRTQLDAFGRLSLEEHEKLDLHKEADLDQALALQREQQSLDDLFKKVDELVTLLTLNHQPDKLPKDQGALMRKLQGLGLGEIAMRSLLDRGGSGSAPIKALQTLAALDPEDLPGTMARIGEFRAHPDFGLFETALRLMITDGAGSRSR